MPGRGDPALENRISLTRNTPSTHASVEGDHYINMLRSHPLASNKDAVHRWPELRFSLAERPIAGSPLLAGLNLNYVNFARDDFGYDDVSWLPIKRIDSTRTESGNNSMTGTTYKGGQFDPQTDLVRAGQRLDIKPEISYPFAMGSYVDVLPTLQLRHTQYSFNVASPSAPYETMPARSYALARMSARTRFYRIYGVDSDFPVLPKTIGSSSSWVDAESRASEVKLPPEVPSRAPVYRHEIMPEIVGTYLPYLNQPDHPFFAQGGLVPIFLEDIPISDTNFSSDQSSIQFDYYDRLATRNTISLWLTNRLVRKRWLRGTPEYKQIASWRLSQGYDFDEAARQQEPRLPLGDLQSLLDVHLDQLDVNSRVRYFPYHRVTTSTSYVRLRSPDNRQFVQTGFSQNWRITREPEKTQKDDDSVSVSTGFLSRFLDLSGTLEYRLKGRDPIFVLNSWATDLNIKPPGNCWGIRVHYEQQFAGPTAIKFDFDYNFGGA